MTDHDDTAAMETAKDLTGAVTELAVEVKRLRTYGRRNRKWIVFDIAITIVLAAVTFVAIHASADAHDAQVSAVAAKAAVVVAEQDNRNLCLSSNVARAQQIALWNFVLGLDKGKPMTVKQQKTIAAFRHELALIYAPRDCSHVSPGNPGPTP